MYIKQSKIHICDRGNELSFCINDLHCMVVLLTVDIHNKLKMWEHTEACFYFDPLISLF